MLVAMDDSPNWPAVNDRYDPYDPAHPMWADRFWGEYCSTRPTATPTRSATTDSES